MSRETSSSGVSWKLTFRHMREQMLENSEPEYCVTLSKNLKKFNKFSTSKNVYRRENKKRLRCSAAVASSSEDTGKINMSERNRKSTNYASKHI